MSDDKTVRVTQGLAVANPLKKDLPVWEKAGWKADPKKAPKRGKTETQMED